MTGTYVPELQAVDTLLQNFMVGKPIPGGTITITHNDKVIYERGIGYSNAAKTVPMQETALMRLASVSKPITASAIQQLAKDGQLNLSDKVFNINGNGGLLNITPYNGTLGDSRLQDITVQHLLEHRGGWNRDTAGDLAFRDVQIANAMGLPSPPGIANTAKYILSRPLQFTPGTAYSYSNVGYMFLGMVVEEASGQAYESYLENHVLTPAGIPAWEVDAGRTFAADQNPREPVYSDPLYDQNVFNPTGPSVPWPYGGWDNERALAFAGLISSSKAIALFAQSHIAAGPEIGKLRTDYTTYSEYRWYHGGSLPGTDTLIAQRTWQDITYSILFDRRPTDGSSYSDTLSYLLESALEGLSSWPAALVYAGDFTNDQWLTLDDITLFTDALALGSEAAFTAAYPTARYGAGDVDGDGLVSVSDAAGFIDALRHAGVPGEYVALVPELPGDYNRNDAVDAADYTVWRDNFGRSVQLPNETFSLGLVDDADYEVWKSNFGQSLAGGSGASLSAKVPEPSAFILVTISLVGIACCSRVHRHSTPALQFIPAILPLVAFAASARADIFQWEYINPTDPSQGKRQSATLTPGGAGVDAGPGANLSGLDLAMAYLIGADLRDASFAFAGLRDADFTGADIRGTSFLIGRTNPRSQVITGTGIAPEQLYSTASYHARDLSGIDLTGHDLARYDLTNQMLVNASFYGARVSDADFSGADVRGASFGMDAVQIRNGEVRLYSIDGTDISLAQLYTTASYQNHDLSGVGLGGPLVMGPFYSGADFRRVNLSFASFGGAGADLEGADFSEAILLGAKLLHADLAGANFTHANLANASLFGGRLTNADFTGANVNGASFARSGEHYFIDYSGHRINRGGDGSGITFDQLKSTASYEAHDLSDIDFSANYLAGGNFAGQNLNDASFAAAVLTGADFTGAAIRGTRFDRLSFVRGIPDGSGITLAQLYSTASYHARDLSGIGLGGNNLAGGNFAGQNVTNVDFTAATLTGADFTAADARGAIWFNQFTTTTTSLIMPDGRINGLRLLAGGQLVVRDYDGYPWRYDEYGKLLPPIPIPITIDQDLAMGPGGTLRMVFEADAWDSTISFAPGIPVTLGGTLELTFATDVNLASQVGRTFHVFNWTGVTPAGAFAISSSYTWDLSNLYSTGEVTLIAVPESGTSLTLAISLLAAVVARRARKTLRSNYGDNQ